MTKRVVTGHMGMSPLGVGNIYCYMRLFQENKHEHSKVQMNTNRHVKQIYKYWIKNSTSISLFWTNSNQFSSNVFWNMLEKKNR